MVLVSYKRNRSKGVFASISLTETQTTFGLLSHYLNNSISVRQKPHFTFEIQKKGVEIFHGDLMESHHSPIKNPKDFLTQLHGVHSLSSA